MTFKFSGQLPLTSFFRPSDRNRNRRKENVQPVYVAEKRKRVITRPDTNLQEPPAKKRKGNVLPQESSSKPRASTRKLDKGLAPRPDTISLDGPLLLLTPRASSPVLLGNKTLDLNDRNNEHCQSTTTRAPFFHNFESATVMSNGSEVENSSTDKRALPTPPATNRPNQKIVSLLPTLDYIPFQSTVHQSTRLSGGALVPWTPETPRLASRHSSTIKTPATPRKTGLRASVFLGTTGSQPSSSPSSTFHPLSYCAKAQKEWTNAEVYRLDGLREPIDTCHFRGIDLSKDPGREEDNDPFVVPAQSQLIVPSSQSLDIRFPYPVPSSQVAPPAPFTENSPVFKLPALPDGSRSFPKMSPRTEEMFVPSSQTQCMTLCDTPRHTVKEQQPVRSETLLLDYRPTLTLGEIVQSSQSQLERSLTFSRGPSQIFSREFSTTEGFGAPHGQSRIEDKSTDSKTHISEALLPEPNEILRTPHSSLRSPSLSHTYTSPPQIPSGVGTASDSDGEEISTLPTQMRIFRDMFDDEPSWVLEGVDSFDVCQALVDENADSATESESENDAVEHHAGLMHGGPESNITVFDGKTLFQPTPKSSHRKYSARSRSFGVSSLPSSDSFEFGCATSPVCVPADLMLSTDAADSCGSMGSLPSPLKEFRDMFEGSGSWPPDFPLSLRS